MIEDDNKDKTSEIITCRHCGNRAPMKIVAKYDHVIELGDPPYNDNFYYYWSILLCPSCEEPTFREIFRSTFEQDIDRGWPSHYRILYPNSHSIIDELPEIVKRNYEVALRIKNIDPNSFAVSIGRTLEAVCNEQGAPGKSLFDKLKYLEKQNGIPGHLAEMAEKLRLLRNIGAHLEGGEIEKEDVPLILNFCESILDYIYRAPNRIKLMQLKIDSLKLKKKSTGNNE